MIMALTVIRTHLAVNGMFHNHYNEKRMISCLQNVSLQQHLYTHAQIYEYKNLHSMIAMVLYNACIYQHESQHNPKLFAMPKQ